MSHAIIRNVRDAWVFILGGRSRFTIRSLRTQTRFTYRVTQSEDNQRLYFVSVLRGSDNESDYQYIGTLRNGRFAHGQKSRIGADAPCVVAFQYLVKMLHQGHINPMVEFWHEGRCARCARPLTDPESITSGFGPECRKHMPVVSMGDL